MQNKELRIPKKDATKIRLVINQALQDMARGEDSTYARFNPASGKKVIDQARLQKAKEGIAEMSRILETYVR